MINLSRMGFCLMDASEEGAAQFTNRPSLGLRNVDNDHGSIPPWELEPGCGSVAGFKDGASVQVHESERRPDELRLPYGTAFEYLLISFRPDLGEDVCSGILYVRLSED